MSTRFQGLVKILKLMSRQDFEAVVGQHFAADAWLWSVVMKFNLGRYSEARFGQDFEA